MAEPQLAPEWLSSKLPSSSQDKVVIRSYDRENKGVRRSYNRTHSYNYLPTHPSSSSNGSSPSPSESSSSWRSAEPNPRVLNRSKSSPLFESKDSLPVAAPKSPDRSNSERNFHIPSPRTLKPKPKTKPPLVASRSQPNLFAPNMVVQQKLRSSTYSHNSSLSSSSSTSLSPSLTTLSITSTALSPSISSPPSNINVTPIVTIQPAPPPIVTITNTNNTTMTATTITTTPTTTTSTTMTPAVSAAQEEMNKELEKLRGLVPSVPAINTKGLPRVRGLEAGGGTTARKLSQSKLLGKRAPQAIHFRKASSEPLLQQLPLIPRGGDSQKDEAEVKRLDPVFLHKIKSIKNEKMRLKETLEDSDKALLDRNNFFLKVIHQEKRNNHLEATSHNNHLPKLEENSSLENGIDDNDDRMDEAEEKFLRELGWVPEEEHHVALLEEEEIAEARERLAVAQQR